MTPGQFGVMRGGVERARGLRRRWGSGRRVRLRRRRTRAVGAGLGKKGT